MVTHEAWSLRDVKTIFHMKDGIIAETEHTKPGSLSESLSEHLNKQLSSIGGVENSSVENEEEKTEITQIA